MRAVFAVLLVACGTVATPVKTPVTTTVAEVCPGEGIEREACLLAQGATYSGDFSTDYTIAVATATPLLARTDTYGFMSKTDGFTKPGTDAETILALRYGICGNHTALALALFDEVGIDARPVQFYYQVDGARRSHSTVEVFIDSDWRYIDTTYGAVWISDGRLATLSEVLADPSRGVRWNSALLPFADEAEHPLFDPLEADADIIRGGEGTVRIGNPETFDHIPRYVGKGISLLIGGSGTVEVTVDVDEVAASDALLCVDDSCQQVIEGAMTFTVVDPHMMTLTDGYATLDEVAWVRRG